MAYVDIAELQRVAGKPTPTAAEQTAMQRVLDEAGREIDWELSFSVDNPAPSPGTPEYAILAEVNLARAHELWNVEFRPSGLLTAGADTIPLLSAQDSWRRHALRLLPLKTSFGIA